MAYLVRSIDIRSLQEKIVKPGTYSAAVRFVVDKEGGLSKFEVTSATHKVVGKEALRAVRGGPKWKPAIQNGRTVSAYKTVMLTVVVPS